MGLLLGDIIVSNIVVAKQVLGPRSGCSPDLSQYRWI
jgi:multisubunit Na+/H+ antiporter MnhE subunit